MILRKVEPIEKRLVYTSHSPLSLAFLRRFPASRVCLSAMTEEEALACLRLLTCGRTLEPYPTKWALASTGYHGATTRPEKQGTQEFEKVPIGDSRWAANRKMACVTRARAFASPRVKMTRYKNLSDQQKVVVCGDDLWGGTARRSQ